MRRENQIVIARMHEHFVGSPDRQVRHEPIPVLAVVERDEEAELRRRVEQVAIDRILADRIHVAERRQIAGDRRPRLAVVGGLEDVRLEVVVPVAVEREYAVPASYHDASRPET